MFSSFPLLFVFSPSFIPLPYFFIQLFSYSPIPNHSSRLLFITIWDQFETNVIFVWSYTTGTTISLFSLVESACPLPFSSWSYIYISYYTFSALLAAILLFLRLIACRLLKWSVSPLLHYARSTALPMSVSFSFTFLFCLATRRLFYSLMLFLLSLL